MCSSDLMLDWTLRRNGEGCWSDKPGPDEEDADMLQMIDGEDADLESGDDLDDDDDENENLFDDDDDDEDDEDEIAKFREFLDRIDPDDFEATQD